MLKKWYDGYLLTTAVDEYDEEIGTCQNDASRFACCDDVMTMLVHLGYLTYDAKTKEVFLPNTELKKEFAKATSPKISAKFKALSTIIADSVSLLEDTWNHDAEKIAEAIQKERRLPNGVFVVTGLRPRFVPCAS